MTRFVLRTALAICFAALASLSLADDVAGFRFVPDESRKGLMSLERNTWTTDTETHLIRLQQLSGDERAAFIEHVTGARIDPFLTPPDEEPRYLTFLIRVENRTEGTATFNPHDCWIVTNRRRMLSPLVLDDLATSYRHMGSELPEAYGAVRPALLENRTMLMPGESIAGLLIFGAFKNKTRNFQIDVSLKYANGDTIRTFAPYRRRK